MPEFPADILVDIITGISCLVLSAFFSASETAITSLGPLKTKHLIESSDKPNKHLRLWLHHPGRVLTTILTFNNVANILASAITTKVAINYFDSYAIGIATGSATFLILIFGEIIPKSFAKANAEPLAIFSLRIIQVFYHMIYPVVIALSETASFIIRSLGSKDTSLRPSITEEELEFLVNESGSTGVIEDYKKAMINGVFEFDETIVREIMTPRTDIIAVDKTDNFESVVKLCIRTGHSRIPVYDDRIDVIIGIVFAKDLLRLAHSNGNTEKTPPKIPSIMREPFFVPESRASIDVFKDLKRTKNHMAIVIDEHGGTAGIVTMEDILEEIVGEIQDEFDVEEAKILEVETGIYDVAGSVNFEEFLDFFELDKGIVTDGDSDVDTIAGVVMQQVGVMPKVGQKTKIGPLRVEVTETGLNRIERLRVSKSAPMTALHPDQTPV